MKKDPMKLKVNKNKKKLNSYPDKNKGEKSLNMSLQMINRF